jgi:hypothetical protein
MAKRAWDINGSVEFNRFIAADPPKGGADVYIRLPFGRIFLSTQGQLVLAASQEIPYTVA